LDQKGAEIAATDRWAPGTRRVGRARRGRASIIIYVYEGHRPFLGAMHLLTETAINSAGTDEYGGGSLNQTATRLDARNSLGETKEASDRFEPLAHCDSRSMELGVAFLLR